MLATRIVCYEESYEETAYVEFSEYNRRWFDEIYKRNLSLIPCTATYHKQVDSLMP